jgi:serine/threonine protein kinase
MTRAEQEHGQADTDSGDVYDGVPSEFSGLSIEDSGLSLALRLRSYPVPRTTLAEFVNTLQHAGLSGPVTLIGRQRRLGKGGQFAVYEQEVTFLDRHGPNHSLVAIKQPLLPSDDSSLLEFTDPRVQRNLKNVSNEIKALTHPKLRQHPNVVKLLSWAFNNDYNRSLVLVLELAREDLERALASQSPPDLRQRVLFCADIENGLETLHDAGFVHGDLKPANVLVFRGPLRFVAKLADFGHAVEEGDRTVTSTVG